MNQKNWTVGRAFAAMVALSGASLVHAQSAYVCDAIPRASGNHDEHVVTAPDGAVWYGDLAANRLIRVAPDRSSAAFVPVDAASARISGLTIGPDGALWFSKDNAGRIGRLPLNGGPGTEFTLPAPSPNFANDLKAGSDGNLWYHDPVKQAVGRVSTAGAVTLLQPPPFAGKPFMSRGLAIGPDGGIWVTDAGRNAVHRVDATTGQFDRFDIPTPTAQPKDIVAAADGNLWFTMPAVRKLGRITPQGAITEYPLAETPTRLLPAPDGMLWISFSGTGTLGRFDTRAGRLVAAVVCGFNAGALTFGTDGQVWALGNTKILILRPRMQAATMPVAATSTVPLPIGSTRGPTRDDPPRPARPGVSTVQSQDLMRSLQDTPGRVLVQFSSPDPRCGYCIRGNPPFDELAARRRGDSRLSFVRVMYQPWTSVADSDVARSLGLTGLPAVLSFEGGKLIKLQPGWATADKLELELLTDLPAR